MFGIGLIAVICFALRLGCTLMEALLMEDSPARAKIDRLFLFSRSILIIVIEPHESRLVNRIRSDAQEKQAH
jgi:hypothetical protein